MVSLRVWTRLWKTELDQRRDKKIQNAEILLWVTVFIKKWCPRKIPNLKMPKKGPQSEESDENDQCLIEWALNLGEAFLNILSLNQ
jgi:hypothetical protein